MPEFKIKSLSNEEIEVMKKLFNKITEFPAKMTTKEKETALNKFIDSGYEYNKETFLIFFYMLSNVTKSVMDLMVEISFLQKEIEILRGNSTKN